MSKKAIVPNLKSDILSKASVIGCGVSEASPTGFATLSLLVPLDSIEGKNPVEIQKDLGLPWADKDGNGFWFEENK